MPRWVMDDEKSPPNWSANHANGHRRRDFVETTIEQRLVVVVAAVVPWWDESEWRLFKNKERTIFVSKIW